MGSDLSVVNAARVSFGKKSDWLQRVHNGEKKVLKKKDVKLINYLAKHKHTSPFGHCFATFHVKAPIFCARQLVKHKFLRWNEISRRYVSDDPEFFEPDYWRGRSKDKKQGSEGIAPTTIDPDYINTLSLQVYRNLLKSNVAPEQARMVLSQATMTEWYWSGSLDAWADMCRLRVASDTQEETQQIAKEIALKMSELFPVSWGAIMNADS